MVPNPYNRKKISRIRLSPDTVDCIVFWTKNPEPLLPYLKEIDDMGYQYYFQITITDYRDDLEPGVPCTEDVMATMLLLSETIGQERIDWRFYPLILTDRYTADYHADMFETMCQWLNKAAERCIISFVDSYRGTHYPELEQEEIEAVAERLSRIASRYRVPLYACAEKTDLARYGIGHSSCIDKEKIKRVIGYKLDLKKDRGQRLCPGRFLFRRLREPLYSLGRRETGQKYGSSRIAAGHGGSDSPAGLRKGEAGLPVSVACVFTEKVRGEFCCAYQGPGGELRRDL